MFGRILNILLILTIITCPVRCLSGSCCCSSESMDVVTAKACCCSSKSGQSDSDKEPAQQPQEIPSKKCNCLCAGATLQPAFTVEFDFQCMPLFFTAEIGNSQLSFNQQIRCRGPDVPLDVSPANKGRMLRYLHSSLTL